MLDRYLASPIQSNSILYHGSPHRPGNIAFGLPGNMTPRIASGSPFYTTSSLNYATHFARGGVVSALHLTQGSVIDFHHSDLLHHLLEIYDQDPKILRVDGPWNADNDGDIEDSAYRLLESPRVMTYLQESGFAAVYLPEDNDLRVTALAILDPDCILFSHVVYGRYPHKSEPTPNDP